MYWRTYFTKDNVITKDSYLNQGANPVVELFYGGTYESPKYSRYIFKFEVERLKELYSSCQLGNLSEVTHKIILKPTGFFGSLSKYKELCRATSYELCLFRLTQDWDEGCGYDFDCSEGCKGYVSSNCNTSYAASNWYYAKDNELWNTEGIYDVFSADTITNESPEFSGEPIYLTCVEQSCDSCQLEIDVTPIVNDLISGDTTNYGFGLAFASIYEINPEETAKYLGFYSKETENFFQPFLETEYINPIIDDRNNFYTDKPNQLHLYVNIKGEPENLTDTPLVNIYDEFDELYTTISGECVAKGIYKAELIVPSSGMTSECAVWRDEWTNLQIRGRNRPNVDNEFQLKNGEDYYQIGFETYSPTRYKFSVFGVAGGEKIRRGDVRKIIVRVYENFQRKKSAPIDNLFYRLYVKEGIEELDIIKWTPVNISSCENFVYLYTEYLIPQFYFLDFKYISNGEERTYGEAIDFEILDDNVIC